MLLRQRKQLGRRGERRRLELRREAKIDQVHEAIAAACGVNLRCDCRLRGRRRRAHRHTLVAHERREVDGWDGGAVRWRGRRRLGAVGNRTASGQWIQPFSWQQRGGRVDLTRFQVRANSS